MSHDHPGVPVTSGAAVPPTAADVPTPARGTPAPFAAAPAPFAPAPSAPAPAPVPGAPLPGAPVAPAGVAPVVPAPESPLLAAWRLLLAVLGHVWRGTPVQAIALAIAPRRARHAFWLLVDGALALGTGLVVALLSSKAVSGVADFGADLTDSFTGGFGGDYVREQVRMPAGVFVGIVLVVAVTVLACLVLRAVTVGWTFSLRGAPQPFVVRASLGAAASAVHLLPLALALLVVLVPGMVLSALALPVLAVLTAGTSIVAETMLYVGLNRTVRFAKSPLVPHAALTVAWFGFCGLVVLVVNGAVLGSLLS